MKEFQGEKGIYMYKQVLETFINDIHTKYKVELAICEVFDKRWSYVFGTEDFIGGSYKIKIDHQYGVIINCTEAEFEKIKQEECLENTSDHL
jgi:roadblock/LC7 domain-containing protein